MYGDRQRYMLLKLDCFGGFTLLSYSHLRSARRFSQPSCEYRIIDGRTCRVIEESPGFVPEWRATRSKEYQRPDHRRRSDPGEQRS